MVSYKKRALNDLRRFFDGLLKWSVKTNTKNNYRQVHLGREDVIAYCDRLKAECESLDSLNVHFKTKYYYHSKFGEYVHNYKPSNKRTTIYIIYDIKKDGIIDVKKISTNYKL